MVEAPSSRWGLFRPTVEPALVALIFIAACAEGAVTNLLSLRVCQNLDLGECNGPLSDDVEKVIQQHTPTILLLRTLIETTAPAFLAPFLGPWSDARGRKLFLALPLLGYSISFLTWGLLSMVEVNPYVYLISSIPIPITGGLAGMVISCYCYITDISPADQRSYRLGVLEAAINLGMILGFFASPILIHLGKSEFLVPFFSCSAIALAAFFYIVFFVKESVSPKVKSKALFNWSHIKDTYHVVIKKRKYHGRTVIFILSLGVALKTLSFEGEAGVRYLVVRNKFSWGLKEFSEYVVLNTIITFFGSWLTTWLFCSFLKLPEMPVSLVSMLVNVIASIGMTLSRNPLAFYITTNLSLLRSVPAPLMISHVIKIVPKADVGKVVSFQLTSGAVTPLLASILYNSVYKLVEREDPMSIYNLSTAINSLSLCIILITMVLERKRPKIEDEKDLEFEQK